MFSARKFFLALSLLVAPVCFGQTATVTGTITDLNGNPYANGTASAIKVVPSGQDAGRPTIVTTNASGFFTMTIPSNQSYVFTLCSNPVNIGPTTNPTPKQVCFSNSIPISITISQDISSILNPIAAQLGPSTTATTLAGTPTNCSAGNATTGIDPHGNAQGCFTPVTGAAGSPPQTQVNDPGNPGHFGGTPCENFPSLTAGPINADCEWHPKGPDPYVDITRFGARTCNPNATPCIAGITGSINSGSSTLTISSTSCPSQVVTQCFVNGDGIVVYNAGAAITLSTPAAPTVTNVLAEAGTGTDLVVPSAAGSTTKCYKIIARTVGGGYTPASPETCTTTGQATLGVVTVNLSGCTRSIITVTCTTASPHPIAIGGPSTTYNGGEVYIGSTSVSSVMDSSFRGWRPIQSATDSTHFTFQDTTINTANGATTTCSGCGSVGTATFFVANHLSWTAVANAWLYYIYGGASGAETLIGVSRPQNIPNSTNYTTWDDFTNIMQNYTFPPWIPTTPPSVGGNDNLSTTISSGSGTTTLTLAASAGTTVSNVGIRQDASPGIIAAAAFAQYKGVLLIPADPASTPAATQFFVISNYCDLTPYNLSIIQSGALRLHETLVLRGSNGLRYDGATLSASLALSYWEGTPFIDVAEAVPGIFIPAGQSYTMRGLYFRGIVQNGALDMVSDNGGFNTNFDNVTWNTGGAPTDLMGYGLILRNVTDISMNMVGFNTGGVVDGSTHNAGLFCNQCGNLFIKHMFATRAGMTYTTGANGGVLTILANHQLGNVNPAISTFGPSITVNLGMPGFPISMDTTGHPCISHFSINNISAFVNGCQPTGYQFSSPAVTGGANFVTNIGSVAGNLSFNNSLGINLQGFALANPTTPGLVFNVTGPGGISTGYNGDSIFVQSPPPATPTCAVSAGGSIPLGTYNFTIQPTWYNGRTGTPSLASSNCTTTNGNQTITMNWSSVPGNPKSVFVFVNGQSCNQCPIAPPTQTSVVFTNISGVGAPVVTAVPLGGPTSMLPDIQGMSAATYLVNAPLGSTAQTSVATAARSSIWPDATGVIPVASYQNSAYDNFNRANGAIGSNWTVTIGGYNVSSNVISSTSNSTFNIAFWSGTSLVAPTQFSQATLVNAFTHPIVGVLLTAANNGQGYGCDDNTTTLFIYRITNNGNATLNSVAHTQTVGDVIRLEVAAGGTFTCYINGVSLVTATDTTYTSGSPGLANFGSGTLDNWSGGNLHPIAQLDTEQDWTQPQHFLNPVVIGNPLPTNNPLTANTLYVSNGTNVVDTLTPSTSGQILVSPVSSIARFLQCGNTTTCSAAGLAGTIITLFGGPVAMTAGAVTITSMPFTSSTSYSCGVNDVTATNAVSVTYTSGSSVTFNGTGTDSVRYVCLGF